MPDVTDPHPLQPPSLRNARLPRGRTLVFALLLLLVGALGTQRVEAAGDKFGLQSRIAVVVDQDTGEVLVAKNADQKVPIASLTKLMTALVVIEARLSMDEVITINRDDLATAKQSPSRLPVGAKLTRGQLLLLALMSSENRAAMAVTRGFPGGRGAFVARMNAKARELGMKSTRFSDPSGLSDLNISTARDLLRLVNAADGDKLIRRYSTQLETTVRVRGAPLKFVNTNRLVRNASEWDIDVQKTGFTNAAGRCLVMRATTAKRRLSMVFLDSYGTLTRFADAARVRKHLERQARKPAKARKVASNADS